MCEAPTKRDARYRIDPSNGPAFSPVISHRSIKQDGGSRLLPCFITILPFSTSSSALPSWAKKCVAWKAPTPRTFFTHD